MTLEEKINLGLKYHMGKKHPCDKCPYYPEPDIMLDPRIDLNYDRHVIDLTKDCRDKLISDMAKEFKRLNNENANLKKCQKKVENFRKELNNDH